MKYLVRFTRKSWRMVDLGLIVILKYLLNPSGVTFTDICQQCMSLDTVMVNIVSFMLLKSKYPLVVNIHFGVKLKELLNETLEVNLVFVLPFNSLCWLKNKE